MPPPVSRRHFLGGAAFAAAAQPRRSPNIVLIVADDLGYSHLGCYGQQKIRTPNLDRLALQGARFTQFYAGCAVSAPSRCALMTGLHTGHCSVRSNSGGVPLQPGDVTLSQRLKDAGYATGLFGKWGLGDAGTAGAPNRKGFDEFFGYLHQLHAQYYYTDFLWKNTQRFPIEANSGGKRSVYVPDVIEREALQFIEAKRSQPFFLYLPYTLPHAEIVAPADGMKEYDGQFPETPYVPPGRRKYATAARPRAALAAMITRLDRGVGRVLDHLKQHGLEEDTVVLFTSDNGAEDGVGADLQFFEGNKPLRGKKGTLYEGGIRVPMIVRWPGRVPAGRTSNHVWANWDLTPTLLELAGAPAAEGLDGVSSAAALQGRKSASHRMLYWEHTVENRLIQAARWKKWKAVRDGATELYNIEEDAGESANVARRHPEIVRKLEIFMQSAHAEPRPQIEPASSFSNTDFHKMPPPVVN
jgi:arylsulfatase A-like enzyme